VDAQVAFLGWTPGHLDRCVAWILDRAPAAAHELDLGELRLVVPGARAGRTLTAMLAAAASERERALIPPITITPGELGPALLGVRDRIPTPLTRRLVWIEALRALPSAERAALIPHPPEDDAIEHWSPVAAWAERLCDELGAHGILAREIPERAPEVLHDEARTRWRTLAAAQGDAIERMDALGVTEDWLATRRALDHPPPPAEHAVVLAGVTELNALARAAIHAAPGTAHALVFAPEDARNSFDDLGCVSASEWLERDDTLGEDRIRFEPDTRSAARRGLLDLAGEDGSIDPDAATIGLADEQMLGTLRHEARIGAGAEIHNAAGIPLDRTAPGRLVTLIALALREDGPESAVALATHPDAERAIDASMRAQGVRVAQGVEALQALRADHLVTRGAAIPAAAGDTARNHARVLLSAINDLLAPLREDHDAPGTLAHWALRLRDTLVLVYGDTDPIDPTGPAVPALAAIGGVLESAVSAPAPETLLTRDAALSLIIERLGADAVPEAQGGDAIDAVGWLGLLHDPAPRCAVLGMGERSVPGADRADPLLNRSVREVLGIPGADERLARDIYLAHALEASRTTTFLSATTNASGDPERPSRVLLRARGAALARRVRRFAPKPETLDTTEIAGHITPGGRDLFGAPVVVHEGFTAPDTMNVTDFDAYLRSPLGWYLERHLRLRDQDPAPFEMNAMHIGTLAHRALERFGTDPETRDLDDEHEIRKALHDMLTDAARDHLGEHPPAAAGIQVELLRRRLSLFATAQAQTRRQGWRIAYTERSSREEAGETTFDVDGVPITLSARIDRIDVHEASDRCRVLDYKTGAEADAKKDHRAGDRWKKLQLPLYRHAVRRIERFAQTPIELGYAGLPRRPGDEALRIADWDQDTLESADDRAREIVREIRALAPGAPVPPGDHPPADGFLGFLTGERARHGGLDVQCTEDPS